MSMNRDRGTGGPRHGGGGYRGTGGSPRGGGGYRGSEPEPTPTPLPDESVLKNIIEEGKVDVLVEWAENIGRGLAKNEGLSASQVRGFFGMVRQIEAEVLPEQKELSEQTYRKLVLLKPKLAYQAARERESGRTRGVAGLERVLGSSISLIGRDPKKFRNFVEFFEAILAYHKAAGDVARGGRHAEH